MVDFQGTVYGKFGRKEKSRVQAQVSGVLIPVLLSNFAKHFDLPGLAFSSFTRLPTWLLGKMKLDGRWKVFVKGKNLIYLQGKSSCFLAF